MGSFGDHIGILSDRVEVIHEHYKHVWKKYDKQHTKNNMFFWETPILRRHASEVLEVLHSVGNTLHPDETSLAAAELIFFVFD